jgi:hypothetical protein
VLKLLDHEDTGRLVALVSVPREVLGMGGVPSATWSHWQGRCWRQEGQALHAVVTLHQNRALRPQQSGENGLRYLQIPS